MAVIWRYFTEFGRFGADQATSFKVLEVRLVGDRNVAETF